MKSILVIAFFSNLIPIKVDSKTNSKDISIVGKNVIRHRYNLDYSINN